MDFSEAKRQLEYEDRERQRQWRYERKCRLAQAAGTRMDEFEEELENLPWYKEAYYATRCWLRDFFKGYHFHTIKSRWQRMRRGYGYQDIWSLDGYLEGWLPAALRELAEKTHGHPFKVYDHDGSLLYKLGECCDDEEYYCEDEDCDTHHAIWQQTICRMADGFEAKQFLYKYEWSHKTVAEKELERIAREGLQLFIKNFDSLWD
jgi:hypothetical protein